MNHRMIRIALATSAASVSAIAAPPPPPAGDIDMSILDMGVSEEERMVYGEPAAPQSGNENPEDLLSSSPVVAPSAKKGKKTAELPKALPVEPVSELAPQANEELPPLPDLDESQTMSDADPTVETAAEEEPPNLLEEATVAEEPAAEELPADEGASEAVATSTRRTDRTIPYYDRENPSWGVDIHGSINALGSTDLVDDQDFEYSTRNFGLGFEYQPKFMQSFGVFTIGPSFNMYIVEPMGDLTSGAFSILSLGGSLKYQFRYFRAQPVVPFVGFEYQMIRYRFREPFESGITTSTGLTFGAMLLLNWMEPSSAHSLWSETGIKRSYLVGEMKQMTAGEPALSVDGSAIYFGLRLEY